MQERRTKIRKIRLTRQERAIEENLLNGEYLDVGTEKFEEIAQAIAARRKDAVLNIRINSHDLRSIKQKAQIVGLKYQTFISEILHRIARAH